MLLKVSRILAATTAAVIRNSPLQRGYDYGQEKYEDSKTTIENLKEGIRRFKSSQRSLDQELESMKRSLRLSTSSKFCLEQQLELKFDRVCKLESEKILLAPLVRIGAEIRLRSLEAFETDADVDNLLVELKDVTDEIFDMQKSRNRRRR